MRRDEKAVQIADLIDDSVLSPARLSIVVLCACVVLLDGYDIQTMALAVPSLGEAWGLPAAAFTLPLSASVFGMLIGTAVVAPAGDRFGRRPLLIWGMVLVGGASLATAFSSTPAELVLWRLLTGIGLGCSLPNATALTSEYVPLRTRAFLITAMYISIALGALLAGFTAPALIERFGWQSLFIVGGALPLGISVFLALYIPESVRLLLAQRRDDERIRTILRRFFPAVDPDSVVAAEEPALQRRSVIALFAPAYRSRTALLWAIFALNLFVLFILISWLPTILTDAGWSRAAALRGAVLIQGGGIVGGLLVARLVDRGVTIAAMVTAYLTVAAAFGLFLVVPADIFVWSVLLCIVGAGVSGTQGALTALSAIFYPPGIRATGAGWASASGRLGAVLGPLAGGAVLGRLDLSPAAHLALLIPPILLCAACVGALRYAWREGT